jgi:phage-related protein
MCLVQQFFFYENRNGNVPKEILALCLGMDKLFFNYPKGRRAKRALSQEEYGRVRKALERLLHLGLHKLLKTTKFARSSDDIILFKLKSENNPRLYFTDVVHGGFIVLHGRKKKEYDEDEHDVRLAEERLDDIRQRCRGKLNP